MYEKYYGFKEKPFNTTPDSRFFFPSAKHSEALNSLIYAINERKGFVVITGEIGAGKTTVCRNLLNKLDSNTRAAMITNTHLTNKELIAEVLDEFHVEYKGGTKQKLLSRLNEFLIQQLSADMNIVLIIDEAQNLSPRVLEEVRMLSNLETEREKLVQIILLGQPQLKSKLENIKLEQFRQRIAVYYHLNPLSKGETSEYILHRMKLVSSNGVFDIFTQSAIDEIYEYTKGVPRLINLIADSALLSGFVYNLKNVDGKIIRDVIKERDFHAVFEETAAVQTAQPAVKTEPSQPQQPRKNHKIYCCSICDKYAYCETKWVRGVQNKEQLCCGECNEYFGCMEKAQASAMSSKK
jgi:general secretion pathway protein A